MFDPLVFIMLIMATSIIAGLVTMWFQNLDTVSKKTAFMIVLGIPAFVIGSTAVSFHIIKYFTHS